MGLYEFSKFLHSKLSAEHTGSPQNGRKVFTSCTSDNEVNSNSGTYTKLQKLNTKEIQLPINKWANEIKIDSLQ